jgi:hypothetical protein
LEGLPAPTKKIRKKHVLDPRFIDKRPARNAEKYLMERFGKTSREITFEEIRIGMAHITHGRMDNFKKKRRDRKITNKQAFYNYVMGMFLKNGFSSGRIR